MRIIRVLRFCLVAGCRLRWQRRSIPALSPSPLTGTDDLRREAWRGSARAFSRIGWTLSVAPETAPDDDTLARQLAARVQARPPPAPSTTRSTLTTHATRIAGWLAERLPLTEIRARLEEGYSVIVAYPTLRRFAIRELGWESRPRLARPPPPLPAPRPSSLGRKNAFSRAGDLLVDDETCFWSPWSSGDGETEDIDTVDYADPAPNAEEVLLAVERLRGVLSALAGARRKTPSRTRRIDT